MQLFAFDETGALVPVVKATKQKDYICNECSQVVRVRSGLFRTAHFYHLSSSSQCRQNGKSIEHLLVQQKLYSLFPEGDAFLEYPMTSIGRIADVVWKSKKIVFEIQCSPIDGNEVLSRNEDYTKEGYRVVWIFHDKTFNQKRASQAELCLQKGHYYFTNMDQEGQGWIYDQYEVFYRGERKVLSDQSEIYLSNYKMGKTTFRRHRQFYFKGDIVDRFLKKELKLPIEAKSSGLKKWLVMPYKILHQILLEKACR